MFLFRVVLSKDRAWDDINTLGSLNSCQFMNMNKEVVPYKLPYANLVKRSEEVDLKIQ